MRRRLFCSVVILSVSLSLMAQSSSAPNKADIDPNAMAALDTMGTYLRTLTTFQVEALQTTDDVLDNGQAVQSGGVVNILVARPNRVRAEIAGDDMHRLLFYDGKNFTIYGQRVNYYATVPAPPTIAELIDKLSEKYDIDMPLVDLFMWGSPASAERTEITSALDLGPSSVDGTTCQQYAFRQEGLDWQIWIQQGDYPLPRKLILTTLTDDARPRHTQILKWNLAPSFNDAAFAFDPPEGAQRIAIAEVTASPSKEARKEQGGVK
jgi:hypothetical protein